MGAQGSLMCVGSEVLRMGLCSHRPVRVPMLTSVHCQKCLQWTGEHQNWTTKQWKKVAWSDKSHFLLHHVEGWGRVHRLPGEEMAPACTMGRTQAGGGSVMLWAMFCWETLGPGIHVDAILTQTTYLNIEGTSVTSRILLNCIVGLHWEKMNVQLVSFLVACLLSTAYSEGSVEYCYNLPACNASTWPTLAPHHCNGTRQSPINIVTADVKADKNLTAFSFKGFNDNSTIISIQNIGKSVKIHLDETKMSVSGGGLQSQYNSSQFHIHWGNGSSINGSEHTVDGRQYAMELHIVNIRADVTPDAAVNDSTAYAVLGFFIEATNGSGTPESWKKLTSFLSEIPNKGDSLDIMHELTVDSLLEGVDRTKYYRYLGSLTTPSCDEIVVWTVFKDPIKVSKDLIDLFSNKMHINATAGPFIINNYRPAQALNGRVVTSQPTSLSGSQPSSAASTLHHTLSISMALLYSVLFWCL
ncbi:hypothetical protein PGIGA_G00033660 [Pangasianodon gigas]|uniref:Uncharacterized protein n=1 Tax=Pangasianodon gigas TaxID=30993 RepID=A0ACC5WYB1_PANGG|nr:hypothetical protein [Pangasianodon gigas]